MTLSRRHVPSRSAPLVATLLAATIAASFAGALGGCKQSGVGDAKAASSPASAASVPSVVLRVSPEDLRVAGLQDHASGPVITGSIQPERRADLRAEVAAVVLQVYKENGEPVHKGDLLMRLDDTAIRDSLASADAASRAAAQALDQAQRQYNRVKTLQGEGMSSQQALDDAEVRRNGATSDRVAADSRTVAARQQLAHTEVRAPFDGIVSDRKASAGDTASIGKELLKVIDPTSMRFEGLVSADRIGELHPGQTVLFHVNGYDQGDFVGKIRHVDASADEATRQVAVIVDFAPGASPKTANLYAEGRIATGASQALVLPEESIAREGDKAFVWRVSAGKVHKVPVTLGERDARRGDFVIVSGVASGDQLLRTPGSTLVDGQRVDLVKPVSPSASAAAGA